MKIHFDIQDHQIDEENKKLYLKLCCLIPKQGLGERLRLSAVFRGAACDRRYPVVAKYEKRTDGMEEFQAEVYIQTAELFFDVLPEPEERVTLHLAYCDLEEQWIISEPLLELPGALFQREREEERGRLAIGRRFLYVGCTLLLPIWILDGWLAVKGCRKLHPAAAGRSGKSALLYHAHGLVKGWTGYGYSLREYKTNYFRSCYEKACRRIKHTERILFLSERRVESGGNLALVRDGLEKKGIGYEQFLTVKPVHRLSRQELRHSAELLAAARLVILEDFFPQLHSISVRRETQILQLWHACGAFKLFGLSELGIVDHLEQSTRNHRNYSAALASSEGVAPFYSEAFGIREACVKPIGVPRTDIFFDASYQKTVRQQLLKKYPVCQGKRVVLFAPTFRGSGNKTAYYPMERFPVEWVVEQLPSDMILVVKHHPFVQQPVIVHEKYKDRVLDLSQGENINDLLFITSLLITDYSSVIFEAALLQLPVLFYAFDLMEYMEERDLYFDFVRFAPGRIVQNVQELVDEIRQELEAGDGPGKETAEKSAAFRRLFLGALDGHSTERTLKLIEEMAGQGKRQD